MTEPEPRHVDDFIDDWRTDPYAAFVLNWMRMPAMNKGRFEPWMGGHLLFCTYRGKPYRVTMASRLGDIGLTTDLTGDSTYSMRVFADDCTGWSAVPP